MDPAALLAAYDQQLRVTIAEPPRAGIVHERDGPLVRVVGQLRGFVSAPRDIGPRGPHLDALIARQRDRFAARGETVEWTLRGHDLPRDLPDRLRAAGFLPEAMETVMIGIVGSLADEPAHPPGVTIRATGAAGDMRRIAAMQTSVWGRNWGWLAADLSGRVAADPDGITVLVAEAEGEVVAAAWLVIRPGTEFGLLWGGATVPAWRGRGLYRALVSRRARLASARGIPYLQVDASSDSRPILEQLGFIAITTTTPYVWAPSR